jgi:hypothetical protein
MTNVTLNGDNIDKYVMSVSEIKQSAGEYGQLTSIDLPSLTGENTTEFWDTTNPASPFYGNVQLSKNRIEIIRNGVSVFNGVITAIESDDQNRSANVSLKSDIQRVLEKDIIYASEETATPSQMVSDICSFYNIGINATSFSRSNSIYTQNNIKCSAFYKGDTTIQNAIQQIAEIGVARAYISNQLMNFDVFRTRTAAGVFTVSDDPFTTGSITLKSNVTTMNLEKEPKQGYRIEYVNGEGPLAATLGNESQQEFTISAGNSNPVRINNLVSAVWIGEKWIEYFNRPQQMFTFGIPAEIGKILNINDPITLIHRDRGLIDLDIVGINNSKKVVSIVEALSR